MAEWYCGNCSEALGSYDNFCANCGHPAHETSHAPAPKSDGTVCPNCGGGLRKTGLFRGNYDAYLLCDGCGHRYAPAFFKRPW